MKMSINPSIYPDYPPQHYLASVYTKQQIEAVTVILPPPKLPDNGTSIKCSVAVTTKILHIRD